MNKGIKEKITILLTLLCSNQGKYIPLIIYRLTCKITNSIPHQHKEKTLLKHEILKIELLLMSLEDNTKTYWPV